MSTDLIHDEAKRTLKSIGRSFGIVGDKAFEDGFILGRMSGDSQAIDENTSDGFHTFKELYRYRMLYNAAFLNCLSRSDDLESSCSVISIGKSRRHSDGEIPFDGGWFIVWVQTDEGTVSNHYENRYWDLFDVDEHDRSPEYLGTTPDQECDVLEHLISKMNVGR